jgi:hypothetical protein
MTADTHTCGVCAIDDTAPPVPATHRGSTFGVRPDHEAEYFCCTHAWHGGLDRPADPVLPGAVCEAERVMRPVDAGRRRCWPELGDGATLDDGDGVTR